MAVSPRYTKDVFNTITDISAVGETTIITATGSDYRIYGIMFVKTDANARDALVKVAGNQAGILSIVANAGNTNAIPAVGLSTHANFTSLFKYRDNSGVAYFDLESGKTITVTIGALGAGEHVYVLVHGAKYN